MAKFHTQSLVGFTSVVALLTVVSFNPPFAEDVSGVEAEDSLTARVATLEKTVAELRQQIHNDKLTSSLAGHYWVEESRIVAGEREKQSEEVAWRLSAEVSSNRCRITRIATAVAIRPPLRLHSLQPSKAWLGALPT